MRFLTSATIDPAALSASVHGADCGAAVLFLGTVRGTTGTHTTQTLEYSAYEPMAEKVLQEIVREAGQHWPARIALQHRLGLLAVGETAVAVAVACPHRGDAFAAAQYLIDELKRRAPIWKRDTAPDGTSWVENRP
jgi:molybdopterin synthase catalytic subunit